jgi:CubicO group peptidase (beta-lactamase class C family)
MCNAENDREIPLGDVDWVPLSKLTFQHHQEKRGYRLASQRISHASVLLVVLAAFVGLLQAQTTPVAPLTEYVGTYSDAPGHTLEIVAGDDLFAVVDEANYTLRRTGADKFKTNTGGIVSFLRDASGKVSGYQQDGGFHPRVSTAITPEAAALARPRPLGQNAPENYRYRPPADLHDGIAVGNIADTKLGAATANAIVSQILDGTYKDVHSVLLYQDGKLVLEEYFYGYNAQRPHQLRSATKSVVSTLAGIAIDRGALSGVNEPVLPLMGYTNYADPDPRKRTITVDNFLSMSSGLDCDDHSSTSPGREMVLDEQADWVKATLDLPMINNPGTRAYYCSGGVAVVGRLIENAVHTTLPEFAQTHLFGPLGIARADWQWNYNLTNTDKEFSQIHLRSRDMLKLGILFEDEGRWHGQQIVSKSWVNTAMAEHSHVDNTSYGYFWWRHQFNVTTPGGPRQIVIVAAQGNGGQKIYIAPQYHLVAVFTAGGYNAESTPPNTIMEKIILPSLMRNDPTGGQASMSPE